MMTLPKMTCVDLVVIVFKAPHSMAHDTDSIKRRAITFRLLLLTSEIAQQSGSVCLTVN